MTPDQRKLVVTFNRTLPHPIGITAMLWKDDPMTPTQETLLITLARAFRTFLLDRAMIEQRDPKEDGNLVLLNDALSPFDQRDFARGPINAGLPIKQHMLGDPAYQFKLEGETEVP